MNNPFKSDDQPINRLAPEMRSEGDALNLVRKRHRSISMGGIGKFQLTMPVKIGAIALIFAGIVLGVWTMQSAKTPVSDEDLPVIAADFEAEDFKVAPTGEDDTRTPHSDKEFYGELDSKQVASKKEGFRSEPETPVAQVSQEALSVESAVNDAEVPKVEDKGTAAVPVDVVESATATKETYKAPAPTVSTKPKKTLEMAISETQGTIRKTAETLVQEQKPAKPVQKNSAKPVKLVSVTPIASKTYWVQVGSLPTKTAAQKEWVRLQKKAPAVLKGQGYRAVRVDLGKPKGVRYRVHVGPFSRSQAVQKCQALKGSNKVSCLVVKG